MGGTVHQSNSTFGCGGVSQATWQKPSFHNGFHEEPLASVDNCTGRGLILAMTSLRVPWRGAIRDEFVREQVVIDPRHATSLHGPNSNDRIVIIVRDLVADVPFFRGEIGQKVFLEVRSVS
jgi:hypothetical protein